MWIIYGATSLLGRLISRRAKDEGLTPILADDKPQTLFRLAEELGFEARVFDWNNPSIMATFLSDVDVILNCKSPISKTSPSVLKACLKSKTHYFDIGDSPEDLNTVFKLSRELKEAGILAVPGVHADVIALDSFSLMFREKMPDATDIRIAIKYPSIRKWDTAVHHACHTGLIVKHGTPVMSPPSKRTILVPFSHEKKTNAIAIYTGGTKAVSLDDRWSNIATYITLDGGTRKLIQCLSMIPGSHFLPTFTGEARTSHHDAPPKPPGRFLKWKTLKSGPQKPRDALIWGEVKNNVGRRLNAELHIADYGTITVEATIKAAKELLARSKSKKLSPSDYGVKTPSTAFGSDFILNYDTLILID